MLVARVGLVVGSEGPMKLSPRFLAVVAAAHVALSQGEIRGQLLAQVPDEEIAHGKRRP